MFIKLFLCVVLVTAIMSAPAKLLLEPLDVEQEWSNWKTTHKKVYDTPQEEANRYEIFKQNIKKITDHNKKFQDGEVTWSQGLNQFADINQEEFSKTYLGLRKPDQPGLTGAQ